MKVMMNPFIEKELQKCAVAKYEKLNDNTFLIRKNNIQLPVDIELNHFYQIELADYIVNPYEGFTLHENWNQGIKPTCPNMQVEVDQIIGKMIHVKGLGEDGKMWAGWIPRKSITIKKVIA